jgi:hypothetical protein
LPATFDTGSAVIMRQVDPDFDTFREVTVGPATNLEMKIFYDPSLRLKWRRFSNRTIDDDVKDPMNHANLMFILFLGTVRIRPRSMSSSTRSLQP